MQVIVQIHYGPKILATYIVNLKPQTDGLPVLIVDVNPTIYTAKGDPEP